MIQLVKLSIPRVEADYSDLVKIADQVPHEKVNLKVGPWLTTSAWSFKGLMTGSPKAPSAAEMVGLSGVDMGTRVTDFPLCRSRSSCCECEVHS